jgi:K+-transporting ATPase KdpF subunit
MEAVNYGCDFYSSLSHFLYSLPWLRQFPGSGGITMENLIGGIIAFILILYLFMVLLRPEKF